MVVPGGRAVSYERGTPVVLFELQSVPVGLQGSEGVHEEFGAAAVV